MPKKKTKAEPVICSHCCCAITKEKDFAGCRARQCPMKAGQAMSRIFGAAFTKDLSNNFHR